MLASKQCLKLGSKKQEAIDLNRKTMATIPSVDHDAQIVMSDNQL